MRADVHRRRSWARQLGWLILIWALGVAALAGVAFVVRVLMKAAGLSI